MASRVSPNERTSLIPPDGRSGSDHPYKSPHHNLANLSPLHFRLTCFSLYLVSFLVSLDSTIIATLLTPISSSFNASNQASWLGTAYLLSLCCFTPIYGRLSDAMGRKGAYYVALGFFGLGTGICGVSRSMMGLIIGRGVAGIGGGGLQTINTIIMSELVDLRHRGLFQVRIRSR
jgi:MFS family permease